MLFLTQKKYLVFLACLRLSRVRFTVTKRSLLLLLQPKKQKWPTTYPGGEQIILWSCDV